MYPFTHTIRVSFAFSPRFRSLSLAVLAFCLVLSAQTTLAATRTVDNLNDNAALTACTAAPNDCSLRGAISGAAAGDTINFSSLSINPAVISLSGGQITINKNLTVNGLGANILTIRTTTAGRIFDLTAGTITLSGMTITGGNIAGDGGGIQNGAVTTLNGVVVTGNTASGYGGGIESFNNLTVVNSTISNNRANSTAGCGGGIDHFGGTLTITNSTISGNSTIVSAAGNQAGGVGAYTGSGAVTITNSTITNNSNGGDTIAGAGGLLANATIRNTIVAGNVSNTTVPDVRSALTSAGNNLIGNPTGSTGVSNGVNGDQVGTAAAPRAPQLAPLGYYGGGILTHPLLANSTAINAGTATGAPATDSRGTARSGAVDIGAFEVSAAYVAQLPPARQGVLYAQTITPESGAFVYTVTGGALPPGLSLPNTAFQSKESAKTVGRNVFTEDLIAPSAGPYTVRGTPTAAGTFLFTLTATGGGSSAATNYSLAVLAPTAAGASVSGRVLVGEQGLRNAVVYLTGPNGQMRQVTTGSFGSYRFDNVAAGETYIVSAVSKLYQFAPQVTSVSSDIADLNFIAEPR